jgi:hypothetical protein
MKQIYQKQEMEINYAFFLDMMRMLYIYGRSVEKCHLVCDAAMMGLSHITLSCRQQLHAAGNSLTARWLTGQAKGPFGIAAERDVGLT